jgi:hypothetical protein
MSIDTLGTQAAERLRLAASECDAEHALADALARNRHDRVRSATLLVAAVAVAVIVGWLAAHELFGGERSAPPLDSAPAPVVGERLSVPVSFPVPEGWEATRDAQTVELRPQNGSDRSITLVGQPVMVFEPPDYDLKPLRDDLIVWVETRNDLKVTDQFGLDGPDFAWAGTETQLSLKPGIDEAPLIPLPGGPDPLVITDAHRTFHWDVIYLTDSPPLVIASRSADADDDVLETARDALLESLQVPPPN